MFVGEVNLVSKGQGWGRCRCDGDVCAFLSFQWWRWEGGLWHFWVVFVLARLWCGPELSLGLAIRKIDLPQTPSLLAVVTLSLAFGTPAGGTHRACYEAFLPPNYEVQLH